MNKKFSVAVKNSRIEVDLTSISICEKKGLAEKIRNEIFWEMTRNKEASVVFFMGGYCRLNKEFAQELFFSKPFSIISIGNGKTLYERYLEGKVMLDDVHAMDITIISKIKAEIVAVEKKEKLKNFRFQL